MPTFEELKDFIRRGYAANVSRDQLKVVLLQNGWKIEQIMAAFVEVDREPHAPAIPPMPSPAPAPAQPASALPPGVPPIMPKTQPGSMVAPAPATFVPAAAPIGSASAPSTLMNPPLADLKPKRNLPRLILIGVIIIVVLALLGGVAFAFVHKMGPFARVPYAEDNLIEGLLEKTADMHSASYSMKGTITMEPRDKDAKPFTLNVPDEGALIDAYQNDSTRARDVTSLLSVLTRWQSYPGARPYPSSLNTVLASTKSQYSYLRVSGTDPASKQPYQYAVTDGGSNFALTVTFETSAALSAIRRGYKYAATTTPMNGKTVTFTKDSQPYFYVASEPPKPFLESLGEMARLLPPDLSASLTMSAAGEWKADSPTWKASLDAAGDFGDLTYKIDVEALKKDATYYFRINNMPSLFGSTFSSLKGQWIQIDPDEATTTTYGYRSSLSSLGSTLASAEKQYKDNREKLTAFGRKVAGFASEEHLLKLKRPPHAETLDGRQVYQYDLDIRKEAVLPFYQKLVAAAGDDPSFNYYSVLNDQGLLDYLASDEFSQTFDYLEQNVSITLWVDPEGYPAGVEYSFRVVPPDTATALKDKQARLVLSSRIQDINTGIKVDVPKDAKPLSDVEKDYESNLYSGSAGSALVQSNLRSAEVNAEIAYDNNGNSYSKVAFPPGHCAKTPYTLFADDAVARAITSAASGDMSRATCAATQNAYAISVPLPSPAGYSFCVDSTGAAKQIKGAITKSVCP